MVSRGPPLPRATPQATSYTSGTWAEESCFRVAPASRVLRTCLPGLANAHKHTHTHTRSSGIPRLQGPKTGAGTHGACCAQAEQGAQVTGSSAASAPRGRSSRCSLARRAADGAARWPWAAPGIVQLPRRCSSAVRGGGRAGLDPLFSEVLGCIQTHPFLCAPPCGREDWRLSRGDPSLSIYAETADSSAETTDRTFSEKTSLLSDRATNQVKVLKT